MMGLELVTADGRPASRLRLLGRTVITWSPVLLVPLVMRFAPQIPPGLNGIPWWMLVMVSGAIFVAITPARGVPDRIAGTVDRYQDSGLNLRGFKPPSGLRLD